MGRNQFVLAVTDAQRNELSKRAASRRFRARLILALVDGQTYSQVMASLNATAPAISRWKQRFEEEGIAGLDPRHEGSQPRVADAAMQAGIARKTQQKPSDGSTHWSCRKMALALGLSKSTVQRVWKKIGCEVGNFIYLHAAADVLTFKTELQDFIHRSPVHDPALLLAQPSGNLRAYMPSATRCTSGESMRGHPRSL